VNAGANLFPKLYVKMYQAAVSKNLDAMENLQEIINKVFEKIYEVNSSHMGLVLGLKYALSVKGICSEYMATPVYDALTDTQKSMIERFLKETEQYDI